MTNALQRDQRYNWVYQELVTSPDDIVGAIAYVLYKKQKIAYIEGFYTANGRYPEDAELTEFHRATLLKESLDGFTERATTLVDAMLERALADRVRQAEDEANAAIEDKLKDLLKNLEQRFISNNNLLDNKIDQIQTDISSGSIQAKLDQINTGLSAEKGFMGWISDVTANFAVNIITILFIGIIVIGYKAYNEFNGKAEKAVNLNQESAPLVDKPNGIKQQP